MSISTLTAQDTIHLKNGVKIRGTVVEQIEGESLKVQLKDGSIISYPMSIVKKVTTSHKDKEDKKEPNTNIILSKTNNVGYNGFFDFGYVFNINNYNADRLELSTSHGYQFNPYVYLGAGIGFDYYTEADQISIPIFANIRVTPLDNSITPFVDAKIGYTAGDISGFYFSPSIGCRFGLSHNVGLNIGLGYSLQQTKIVYYDIYDHGTYKYTDNTVLSGLNIIIGFDF